MDYPILLNSKNYIDNRGFFLEIFRENQKFGRKKLIFKQDNVSYSKKNVIRGIHYQLRMPQAKFITVIFGSIYDVAVDLRMSSKNFGKVYEFNLMYNKNNQIFIPIGYGHGFQCLSEFAIVHYKCDNFYQPKDQYGIIFNDKTINIKWPMKKYIVSKIDLSFPNLSDSKYLFK